MQLLDLSQCKSADSISAVKNITKYAIEPKMDGWRCEARITVEDGVQLTSRTGKSFDGKVPAISFALTSVAPGTVLDGELVWVTPEGTPDFNLTARILGSGVDEAVAKARNAAGQMHYIVFDMMMRAGEDIRALAFTERRLMLKAVLNQLRSVPDQTYNLIEQITSLTPASLEGYEAAHSAFTAWGGEGSVLKQLDSQYAGKRSSAWLKVKRTPTEDVVIMGFKPGLGKFAGQVGALVFGQYRDGALVERGACSGMDDATRATFTKLFAREDLEGVKCITGAVIEITHNGVLVDGFRHPQFARVRDDKGATECTWTEE
jgi:bifunctional non-homologous end joining protein LigD